MNDGDRLFLPHLLGTLRHMRAGPPLHACTIPWRPAPSCRPCPCATAARRRPRRATPPPSPRPRHSPSAAAPLLSRRDCCEPLTGFPAALHARLPSGSSAAWVSCHALLALPAKPQGQRRRQGPTVQNIAISRLSHQPSEALETHVQNDGGKPAPAATNLVRPSFPGENTSMGLAPPPLRRPSPSSARRGGSCWQLRCGCSATIAHNDRKDKRRICGIQHALASLAHAPQAASQRTRRLGAR